ncbi:MAG: HAD hydrolase family protein [Atopobiaceae bacterium]|nr:HAD hydrolase family protein [Atopobiaceae bacterium]
MFDLDDTIVQAGSYVSQRVLRALGQARAAGYVLSVASGRALCSVHKGVLESGAMDYAVCSNGSTVTRLEDGKVLCRQPMLREDCLECHELLAPYGAAWNAFLGNMAYFEWKGASYMLTGRTGALARTRRYDEGRKDAVRKVARTIRRGMRYVRLSFTNKGHKQVMSILPYIKGAEDGVDKMGCTIPKASDCQKAAQLLATDGRFEVIRMGQTELEITARGVTKGMGVRKLLEHLNLGTGDAVAFGDGANDLPLASAVGCFVAMGNAEDAVKAQADFVCPSVAEDGVAAWIEQHLL